ncbi:MAG TPA: PA14 domain-containing protein, partial [Anaerolineae bacterium]|nr:PA14 domain-containing protein [Anaerolineae bacterium]
VRWTRSLPFAQGDYRFFAKADDGIRVWLDDWLVLDQWHTGPVSASGDFAAVGQGSHNVRVEYFEHLGDASAAVWWAPTSTTHWLAEYYDNIYLAPPPAVVRNDTSIDFNWGLGSPDPALPADNFSARWTRTYSFQPGDYYFSVEGGDGARLWLDDWLIFSDWLQDTGKHSFEGEFQALGAGGHVVRVEWYSRGGLAQVKAWWKRIPGHG